MQEWINRYPLELGYSLFLALWVAVTVLISYISGWSALAQRFRSSTGFVGQKWRGQSAQMRGIGGYNHCLTVGANKDGIYIAILFLFRPGHPALFIPWSEVSIIKRGRWLFFGSIVELRLGRENAIPFRISQGLADRLKLAAENAWPIDTIG
jgi:hypothetical protein